MSTDLPSRDSDERNALYEDAKKALVVSMQCPEVHQAMIEAVRRNFPHLFASDRSDD